MEAGRRSGSISMGNIKPSTLKNRPAIA